MISKDLDSAASSEIFRLHPQCVDPLITHFTFADDMLIFFDGSEFSLDGILEVLRNFYLVT